MKKFDKSVQEFMTMVSVFPHPKEDRMQQIHETMKNYRDGDTSNDDWMEKCLNEIPQDLAELMLVTFVLGTTGGAEMAEQKLMKN